MQCSFTFKYLNVYNTSFIKEILLYNLYNYKNNKIDIDKVSLSSLQTLFRFGLCSPKCHSQGGGRESKIIHCA